AARRQGFRPQRLQGRTGEARRRPRPEPGGRGGAPMTTSHIGKPTSRVDGRAKVTGAARYAAEYNVPDLAYGVVVSSEVTRGRITRIDAAAALALPGVLEVFTHENNP